MIKPKLIAPLYIIFLLYSNYSYSQNNTPGCTDPNAINYNSIANFNNGTCLYPISNYMPVHLSDLNDSIKETSALLFWEHSLWTINDSGNLPYLFQIDTTTGTIIKKYFINNYSNIDWEALAQSEDYIFIGDFGNNAGARQDLRILRITKTDISNSLSDTLSADIIQFNYPEQQSFISQNMNTNWDAEAFFYKNDSLHIFTKDWVNQRTVHYTIPNIIGNHPAQKRDSFDVNGLITDASVDLNGNIILLGYQFSIDNGFNSFTWLLFDYQNNDFFNGNKRRIELGDVYELGQTEGICFKNDYKGYISAEAFEIASLGINTPPQLHRFDFKPYFTTNSSSSINDDKKALSVVIVLPNPSNKGITIQSPISSKVIIYNNSGYKVWEQEIEKGMHKIDCSHWTKGTYILKGNKIKTTKFILE
ncbi:MAG TPA: T9SS type A sorting domain-containing protein [Edaphocola sp.]|nr:T9SS type A sorting domain-containing protein [Edaphocola sp.]